MDKMTFRIVPEYGHFVVYLNDGFFASTDTRAEAEELIDEYVIEYLMR